MAIRFKVVFHYTNGSTATVRNISNMALVEMVDNKSHPADLLMVLDKISEPGGAFGDLKEINRTIVSGETLCDSVKKIEVFSRPLTKRSRYTHSDEAVMLEMSLIDRINHALKREALDTRDELVYGEDRRAISGFKNTIRTTLID